jgi:orotate phosphoribosyltransferase
VEDWLARDRARLLELLRSQSYERRKVTLSSGRESDFYIDCRRTSLTAEGHFLIGRLLFAQLLEKSPRARAIGGPTLGADPLVSAVSLTSYLAGHPMPGFIVRKEPKGHGTGQWIENRASLQPGWEVAILEDVVTTGTSTLKAIERTETEGLKVIHAFALVDRLEGGGEALDARGYRFAALYTRKDFQP